jgi:outer membrane protein assembly factor BamB
MTRQVGQADRLMALEARSRVSQARARWRAWPASALLLGFFGCAATNSAPPSSSVLERNNHASRDGHFIQPKLTKAAAARMAIDTEFQALYGGFIYGSPLYFENGPGGRGIILAASSNNYVYAFDETTGAIVWMRVIGTAAATTGVSCGKINPIGIVSTPIIDAATRTMFVAGAVGGATIERHEVHALSLDDGTERAGWPVDVTNLGAPPLPGGAPITFQPAVQNQRSALSLVHGILYVAYGGHVGDCGPYHGWVVAIDIKDPTRKGAWATGGQGEGIWAAGGLPSDGESIFVTTGNATSGTLNHLDSEEVVRITGLGAFDRSSTRNYFFPASWYEMDRADSDFGSNNPILLPVPGARPSSYVMALSKDGHMYLLDSANLGGMGGAVVDFPVSTGNSIWTAPTSYTAGGTVHVALAILGNGSCPGGTVAGAVVMSVAIPPGAPPKPEIKWCAPMAGNERTQAPISTTTDGKKDAIVWFMSDTSLNAVDGETGALLYNGGADTCVGVRQWTSPIAVKGRIVVVADNHLCSWSPH